MAKRRKLEAPSAEDMGRIEEEFRRETPAKPAAPIAQVAAETAAAFQSTTPEARRDEAQAAAYRAAEGQGRLIKQIGIAEVDAQSMQRDRTIMDEDALDELEFSIRAHGLRLPIEVYPLKVPTAGQRYGLLSGYRRLIAQRNLNARSSDDAFGLIKAVVRNPDEMGGAFVAMVEENEIRQDLSHFERGRIAAIAAQQGAFSTTEAAVAEMFAAASKAKRSKIRSFAMIFEELGDVLRFPEALREKDGLRLAQALRAGAEVRLREALGTGQGVDAASEWLLIEDVLRLQKSAPRDPKRGGRPAAPVAQGDILKTATGVLLQLSKDANGHTIRLTGQRVSDDVIEQIMSEIYTKLEHGA